MSPIMYGALFSVTSSAKKNGAKPDENGLIPFDYKQDLLFKIVEEVSQFKQQFSADEIILAFDNSKGSYWRKDFYDRYKYGRSRGRDESELDWAKAFEVFEELRTMFDEWSTLKVISVDRCEADDTAFVLSEYFSKNSDDTTILHTLDHDWEHNLTYDNAKLFKTRKTQRLPGIYVEKTKEELKDATHEHCIAGDPGDGFLHIKSWTQFSPEFLEMYPKYEGREIELYDKHHLIEKAFDDKMELLHPNEKKLPKAYKHPRFGYKSFKKGKKSLQDILVENPIHVKNYDRNKRLCLPTGIPQNYRNSIIAEYEREHQSNVQKLQSYLIKNGLFELTAKIMSL